MTTQELWQATLTNLEMSLSTVEFASLVKPLQWQNLEQIDNNTDRVILTCQSIFHHSQLKRRIVGMIEETLSQMVGKKVIIDLVVNNRIDTQNFSDAPLFSAVADKEELLNQVLQKAGLKPELTLDNFAVSSTNEMAYAAAKAVSSSPGEAYNPLFLYGGVGVGKTHLMQGVGQAILRKEASTKIMYCSGEEFTNEIIGAIRNKSTMAFRKRYRSVHLLFIDDIQFIAGKKAVQEEFFHTFNAITKEGGQIIMTSDKPPKEIDSLEDRLRSRFEGGLTIDIGQPDFELRSAILIIKARNMGVELPTEVAQIIAAREEDTRALLGKLITIVTLAKSREEVIDVKLVEEVVGKTNTGNVERKKIVQPENVVELVAQYYRANTQDIIGSSRVQTLTLPRHIAMYLLHHEAKLGLVQIGKLFNGRDHTSVIHAVRKIEAKINQETELARVVENFRDNLFK